MKVLEFHAYNKIYKIDLKFKKNITIHKLIITMTFLTNFCVKLLLKDGFITAAALGDLKRVLTYIIEERVDVNASTTAFPFGEGITALQLSCSLGHLDVINTLIAAGADIDLGNQYEKTPLYMASLQGHVDVVSVLLEHGADINKASPNDGRSPFFAAADQGNVEVVRILAERGADINKADNIGRTPLHVAIQHRHVDIVRILVEKGVDMDKIDYNGYIPLITALKVGHHVIDHDPWSLRNVKNSSYGLDAAGRLDMVRLLVEGMTREPVSNAGISLVNYVNPELEELTHVTKNVIIKITNMQEVFNKVDLDIIYRYHTPLQLACAKGDLEVVKILLAAGADVNKGNMTPLYLASSNGHLEVVKFLTEKGADINIKLSDPFYLKKMNGYQVIIEKICCWSPLHIACFNKHFKIINFLIDAGANLYEEYNIYNDKMNPFKMIIDKINYYLTIYGSYAVIKNRIKIYNSTDNLHVKECWKIIEYVLRKYDPCISLLTMTSSNGAGYALNHPEETKAEKLIRWRIEEICDQIENERRAVFKVVKFAKIQKLVNEDEALCTNRINGITEHIFKYL